MAVPLDVERKKELRCAQVLESPLDAAVKEEIVENISATAASTNGFSPEEKIQAMSINQFEMACSDARIHLLMDSGFRRINEKLDKLRPMTRMEAFVRCRWQLMVVAITAIVALVLKPELAELVKAITPR